ncbi:hypothetical protein [Modestobacter versicolor]|uniref:Uncharacterized protein n=1 Tax=Modestobacter versicolor TaxID=429133 RepID=A0A323VQ17_9ACTN|nr:hypothetical protein [Modestobacter versicolor]MBB3674523.1 hypothetical protein [Modestobacter versicolor]PZA21448.1 hypothetical protein DMO24_10220 [Modestobacter versicolor]
MPRTAGLRQRPHVPGPTELRLRLRPGAVVGLDGRPVEAERLRSFADDPRRRPRAAGTPGHRVT